MTQTPTEKPAAVPTQPPAVIHKAFGWSYWMLNVIEMFERLAYYGIRAVVPLYIMQATEPGGLHLTAVHKGIIYAWWAIFQSWLPMFTGGIADRYGYKRTLFFAISANVLGYVLMAYLHSYYGFFLGIIVLASGTAFFKPSLQGSIAQNLTKENSSMGWGIFYWVVNVGAFGAPFTATLVLGKPHSAQGWQNLFLICAAFTCVNLLVLLTFKDVPSGADKSKSFMEVFGATVENIWPFWFVGGRWHPLRGNLGILLAISGFCMIAVGTFKTYFHYQNYIGFVVLVFGGLLATCLKGGRFQWQLRLPIFLGIMTCFWLMMYQLWDLQPNFIEDWIDSSSVARLLHWDFFQEYGAKGLIQVPQQILLNLNAGLIILLVVPISWTVRKMRTLSSMLIGMSMATAGVLVAGLTGNGWVLLLGIVFFSLGEMLTGPKKNEYLGLIAPPGKKGLYLGYVNIPIGFGVGLGSLLAGLVYDGYGEKATLALKELAGNAPLLARAAQDTDWSADLYKIPELGGLRREDALDRAAQFDGSDADATARRLQKAFRYDQGQIINLALQYLALQPPYKDAASRALGEDYSEQRIARHVHELPAAIGVGRTVAFEVLREYINTDARQRRFDSEIIDLLWETFAADPETLNNLALEFLAQSTTLIHDQVLAFAEQNKSLNQRQRIDDIERRTALDRTRSFAALSSARGAEEHEIRSTLATLNLSDLPLGQQLYIYLINEDDRRVPAVGRRDWSNDVDLLRSMIENDPAAVRIVRDAQGGDLNYRELADEQSLIQEALAAKDWSRTPEQAAAVLQINPGEAQAMVAADLNDSLWTTTRYLWDKYDPQYHVWLPFGAIGVAAMIALAIFGQMAKKWKDMNA